MLEIEIPIAMVLSFDRYYYTFAYTCIYSVPNTTASPILVAQNNVLSTKGHL